jgi:hypothetical protein
MIPGFVYITNCDITNCDRPTTLIGPADAVDQARSHNRVVSAS